MIEAEGGKRKAGGRHRGYRIWDMGLGKAESGKRKAEKSEGFGREGRKDLGFWIWDFGFHLTPVSNPLSPARRRAGLLAVLYLGMVSLCVAQETGWKADLKRMGFDEVPVEELEKGEIVGQKWLAGGVSGWVISSG